VTAGDAVATEDIVWQAPSPATLTKGGDAKAAAANTSHHRLMQAGNARLLHLTAAPSQHHFGGQQLLQHAGLQQLRDLTVNAKAAESGAATAAAEAAKALVHVTQLRLAVSQWELPWLLPLLQQQRHSSDSTAGDPLRSLRVLDLALDTGDVGVLRSASDHCLPPRGAVHDEQRAALHALLALPTALRHLRVTSSSVAGLELLRGLSDLSRQCLDMLHSLELQGCGPPPLPTAGVLPSGTLPWGTCLSQLTGLTRLSISRYACPGAPLLLPLLLPPCLVELHVERYNVLLPASPAGAAGAAVQPSGRLRCLELVHCNLAAESSSLCPSILWPGCQFVLLLSTLARWAGPSLSELRLHDVHARSSQLHVPRPLRASALITEEHVECNGDYTGNECGRPAAQHACGGVVLDAGQPQCSVSGSCCRAPACDVHQHMERAAHSSAGEVIAPSLRCFMLVLPFLETAVASPGRYGDRWGDLLRWLGSAAPQLASLTLAPWSLSDDIHMPYLEAMKLRRLCLSSSSAV
jgi:hypothetical protein